MRARLEGLAGECSDLYALDRRPVHSSSWKVVLFDRACSFGRDAWGSVREEGDTRLASQISRIDPGDQWGDRYCSQIALTSIIQVYECSIKVNFASKSSSFLSHTSF